MSKAARKPAQRKPIGRKIRECSAKGFHGINDVVSFGTALLEDFLAGDITRRSAAEVLELFDRAVIEPVKIGVELRIKAGMPVKHLMGDTTDLPSVDGNYLAGLQHRVLTNGKLEPEVIVAVARYVESEATKMRAEADVRVATAQEKLYTKQTEEAVPVC